MGEVYQARDTKLNRLVAVKILRSEQTRNADLQRRFIQEAQAASALNHPNIVTIHDIVSEGGADIMIMECVNGKTLTDLIPKGGLRVPQVLNYGVQISDALAAAHAAGIIHRDLKPGNIMVTDHGLIKILDFGLAKIVTPEDAPDPDATLAQGPLTVEGSIIGTVAYMSPEQAQGKKVDPRSDIFSFGAVLYEMTTGLRAFDGGDTVSTLTAVLRDPPRSMPEVAPDVPVELETLIAKCLFKNPDDRWQSMKEVLQQLLLLKQGSDSGTLYRSRIVGQPPSGITVPPSQPPAPPPNVIVKPRSAWVSIVWALVVLFSVMMGGCLFVIFRPRDHKPKVEITQTIAPTVDGILRNRDVIKMVSEEVPQSLIISQIRASKTEFDLSPEGVIKLVKGDVPETVIEVMRNPQKPLPAGGGAPVPPSRPSADPNSTKPPVVPPAVGSIAPATTLTIPDATPFLLALTEDVADDAAEDTVLHFVSVADVKVNGVTVVAKGAPATGKIVEAGRKRKLLGRTRMSYAMTQVQAVDGKQLRLRATPLPGKADEGSRRPLTDAFSVLAIFPNLPRNASSLKRPAAASAVAG